MKTHLADSARPTKLQCGIDRVSPLGARPMTESPEQCSCRMCLNLFFFGTNDVHDGGDLDTAMTGLVSVFGIYAIIVSALLAFVVWGERR